ncbi:MAG: DNA gyrase subunit A [Christensenellales bacterium]
MDNIRQSIIPIDIEHEMKKSFISYAMAVIINRALPDVRDGLKPVHRRILYAMHELGLYNDKPYRKCARIVGDTLGKYHPHGDSSVYEAMVRLAQDFSTRYMLVQGHGNFGSIDGDSPAAMRYTEARLSKISSEMLRDLEKETVDFYPNFDETLMQPSVMPSRFPNLLVNGSGGIAVGMATNIPPHNLRETIDGCLAMLDNPEIAIEDLNDIITGPDFPTGGIIMGQSGIREAYMTGRGRIIMRAKTETEQIAPNRSRIIVTELPYQVNKARLVEKIAELVHEKKIEGISDIKDHSDREGMHIAIDLKKDVNAGVILNSLYKHTQLQETFGVIMLALVDGEPKILNLREMLQYYLAHQREVIVRRTRFDLARAKVRAHIIEGLVIALDNIDEVIELIKKSPNGPVARENLMERFALSEKQAQAILDMRLQRLTGLEREKIEEEYKSLLKTIAYLTDVLNTPQRVSDIIKTELTEVRDHYGDERRTVIEPVTDDIDMDDLIQEESMVVTMTHFGYIKRLPEDTYRSQRRGGKGITGLSTREEDFVETIIACSTHRYLLFFTNKGRAYRLKCYQIPIAGRQAKGTPIVNMLQLQPGEKVTAVFPVTEDNESAYLMLASRRGHVKKTPFCEFDNIRKGGLIAMSLRPDDELISVLFTRGDEDIILGTRNGKCIRFNESEVRPMGRTAMGVRGIELSRGDQLVNMEAVAPECTILSITENGLGKRSPESEYRQQARGGKGVKIMNLSERTGLLAGLKTVTDQDDIILISADGTIIRMQTDEISLLSRDTQGVRLMRIDEEQRVVCVEKVLRSDEDIDTEDNKETIEEPIVEPEKRTES